MNNVEKARLALLQEIADRGERLTREQREDYDRLAEMEKRDRVKNHRAESEKIKGAYVPAPDGPETRGEHHERLSPDQSMADWMARAKANHVVRSDGSDRDMNRFWAEMCGLKPATMESRTLQEDVTSGAGAAAAAVPQDWSAEFVDLLRSRLVLNKAGMTTIPMEHEVYHMPVWTADVAPSYLAESASVALDANPSIATLDFSAAGAYQDITLISRAALQDASAGGGISGMIQNSITQKFARLVEQVAFYGQAGTPATGAPGIVNESGLNIVWNGTNGAAPVDTTPYSIAAEAVRNANAEPTAFITNPKVKGTLSRLSGTGGFPSYFPMPADVAGLPVLSTTAIVSNKTHGTGTALSSLYCMDWSRLYFAVRASLDVTVLRERYADSAAIGFWSFMRFSVRLSHPEAAVKYSGFITT